MKAKINYKSQKTIIIAIIALALIIISGIAIGMFIKANDTSEAVGENNTISENNDNNAKQNEVSQNQTGVTGEGEQNNENDVNNETVENQGDINNQNNQQNTNNQEINGTGNNNAGDANNNANVPETEYIVGRTELIPERVISENYYVSWIPREFNTTVKSDLNQSNITAVKTVAKLTANGLVQNPESAKVGEILQYTITLTNNSEKINGVVTVNDIIPWGTEFVSATQEKLTTTPTQYKEASEVAELTWKNVKVKANSEVKLVVYVKILETVENEIVTVVKNTATVTEGTTTEEIESPETKIANITKTKTSKVIYNEERPHEHIVVDGVEPLHEQDIIEYTITLINSGEAAGTVKVSDTVPEGTTLVKDSKVTVIDKNGVATYEISELAEGIDVTVNGATEIEKENGTEEANNIKILSTATVTFRVTVNSFDEETKTIKNDMAKVDGDSTNTTEDEAEKVYINITATKEWENIENDAAKEYAVQDILFVLSANGKEIETKQANADNNWTVDFGKQPKYENNEEIIYTVTEKALDEEKQKVLDEHYNAETSIEEELTNIKTTITNTFDLSTLTDTVEVPATKVWENMGSDASKVYAVTSIKLQVLGNNKVVEEQVVAENADEENGIVGGWSHTFTNLPKYDENGNQIIYTVAEVAVNKDDEAKLGKYTQNIDQETGIITNTFDPSKVTDTVNVPAKKVWENMESDAAKVYEVTSIKLQVLGNNKVVEEQVIAEKADEENEVVGEWSYTFANLPKYDENGNQITYTVAEVAVNKDDEAKLGKYTQNIDQETGIIINTFDPSKVTDTVNVPAKKVWENMGSDAAEAYKMSSITFEARIYAEDGTYTVAQSKEVKADANGEWEVTFEDLAKYDENGNEIEYVIDEVVTNPEDQTKLDVYNKETSTAEDGTKVITNTFDPSKVTDTTNIKAEKVWKDNGSAAAEAYKMSSITFEARIYAEDGTYTVAQSKEVKADANGEWKVTFEGLAKYDVNGNEIVYVIDEVVTKPEDQAKLNVYNKQPSTAEDGTKVITNTFDPSKVKDTTNIKAEKVWEDNGSAAAEAYKMSSITFEARIYAEDGTYTVVQSKEVKADANGEWKVTFEGLAKYDANGNEIVYVIDEVVTKPEDQAKLNVYNKQPSTAEDGTKVITNTFDPSKVKDTTNIKAEKVWKDNGSAAAEAYKMSSITFEARIYAEDGTYTVAQSKEVKADANGEWKVTFEDLAKYDENGNEIVYVIEEVVTKPEDQAKLDVYNKVTSTAEDGTKVITNTFDPSKVTDTTEIKAEKVWEDNGSAAAEAYKMSSITFEARIYAEDGTYTVAQSKEVKADANGKWKVTFEDLAKYDEDGNEIVYVIDEVVTKQEDQAKLDVYNKSTSIAEDGTRVITNTFDPSKVTDTTEIKAEKEWKDNGSAAAEAYKMSSITFEARIYAEDGTYTVAQSKEVKADANGEWKVTFEGLAKYDVNGNEIVYVIDEVVTKPEDQAKLDVYNKVTSTAEDGAKVITNTFDPSKVKDTTEVTITKIWEDNSNKYNTRPGSVTIKLSNGTNYELTGAENAQSWTQTINLPKYDNQGNLIIYTATEENVPEGYTKVSEEGTTVTNRANVIVEKSAYKANEDGTIGNEVGSSDEFKANDTVYYKLAFKNAGNTVIESKTLTDTLSLRLELVSINGTAITEETVNGTDNDGYTWECTATKNTEGNTVINWTLTNVPAGAQKELIIKAKVSEEAEYKDLCHIDGDKTDYTAKLYVKKADNSYTNSLGTVYLNSVDLSNVLETLPSNDLYYVLKNNNAIVDLVTKGISRDTLKTALADNGITLAKDEVVVWYAIKNENSEYHIYGEVRKTANLTVINNEVYMDNIKQDDVTIDLEDIEIGQSGTVTVKGVSTSTESVSTPMDIVFIIDTSGSMQGNNATNMKNAVNSTIRTLMDKNENNRIAVVGFSGNSSQTITNSSTIIPLGTYGKNKDYLTLDNNTIYSNVTTNSSRQIVGGTNTQAGIKAGADILTAQSLDRTFTATVNGVSVTGTRTPVLVLVTDGDPTYYYANETATGTRNGNGMAGSTNENYYYWTIRTAKYYKDQVTSKYYGTTGKQAKMFTIGIGIGAEGDYLAKALLDPDATNVGNCNDNTKIDYEGTRYEQDNRSTKKKLYDLLLNSNTDKNPYAYDYADGSKSGALTESDIQNFLKTSLSASSESFNVRNITVEEAKARRIDLTNIDTAKEFLLTITPEEGEAIELNSLEEAKTTNNGENGAYVKVDSTTGGLYVDLTGIDRTSTVNITYWEQQTQAN